MITKVRKQIYIKPQQEQILKRLAELRGDSEAEIIRQAIDEYTRVLRFPARDLAAWQEEKEYIRGLMGKGPVAGKRTWRREDLYER
jgi:hypothetical protein